MRIGRNKKDVSKPSIFLEFIRRPENATIRRIHVQHIILVLHHCSRFLNLAASNALKHVGVMYPRVLDCKGLTDNSQGVLGFC